jgi:hypothetical protein
VVDPGVDRVVDPRNLRDFVPEKVFDGYEMGAEAVQEDR